MVKYLTEHLLVDQLLKKEASQWTSGPILITIATSLTDDTPIKLNISETIGFRTNRPIKPTDGESGNSYFLPSHLNDCSETFREEHINKIFVTACYNAGFNIVASWREKNSCIVFTCKRGRFHNEERNKEQATKRGRGGVKNSSKPAAERDRKSGRAVKENMEETCKFTFRVFWDGGMKRWFLPKEQRGSLVHSGHSHFDSQYLRMESKHALSNGEKKLAADCFACKNSTTATTDLLNFRNDIGLEKHQLDYIKRKKKKDDLQIKGLGFGDVSDANDLTAADRAIALLQNNPKVSYTALIGDRKSGLITLKQKRKGINNSITVEDLGRELKDDAERPEDVVQRELGQDEVASSHTATSSGKRDIPNNLHLKNGQVLLALAWTTDDSRRKFDMFPEIVFGDATEETNSEERPLYTLCGKDNMNKSFAHTWCLLPSNARWAYSWFFEDAVPYLHPGTACGRVKLILTDACPQEFFVIAGCIGEGKLYSQALHRWCGWHKLDRNFKNHPAYKSLLARLRNSSVENSIEVSLITYMIGDIDEDARVQIRYFFTHGFECNKHMLCEGYFEDVMTMGNCTTGVSEAEHRAYKKSANGLRPSDDLCETADKLLHRAETQAATKARSMVHQLNTQSAKASDREKKEQGLSDYANAKLLEEHSQSNQLLAYRESESLFYVKEKYSSNEDISDEDKAAAEKECEDLRQTMTSWISTQKSKKGKKALKDRKDELFSGGKGAMKQFKLLLHAEMLRVIPRFERTVLVELRSIPDSDCGEKMLVCTRCFKKTGYACKHIYKLLGRYPVLTDALIRWRKSYAHYYGVNDEISSHFLRLRDLYELPGVLLSAEEIDSLNEAYPVGSAEAPKQYFLRSVPGKLRLRGSSNNHWKSIASDNAFFGMDACCFACDESEGDTQALEGEMLEDMVMEENVGRDESDDTSKLRTGFCGVSGVLEQQSSYLVPSQDLGFIDRMKNAFSTFSPNFQQAAKLADYLGGEGTEIVRKHFQAMLYELDQKVMERNPQHPEGDGTCS